MRMRILSARIFVSFWWENKNFKRMLPREKIDEFCVEKILQAADRISAIVLGNIYLFQLWLQSMREKKNLEETNLALSLK